MYYYSRTKIQAASEEKEASIQLIRGCWADETAEDREAQPQHVSNHVLQN